MPRHESHVFCFYSIVIIDYLGFIRALKSHNTRDREIAEISAGLKSIAKDLNVLLILLVQINRQVEQRTGHKPGLADIRDSGTIEQDADTVIMIHRPQYYGTQTFDNGEPCKNKAKLIVAKGRNTGTGEIICDYDTQFAHFFYKDVESNGDYSQEEAF
jgi:replicative DNA helicase